MTKMKMSFALLSLMAMAACTPGNVIKERQFDASYWQRAEAVESLYLTGPKAQHQLNKDIASCVSEVKELVRLGSIRSAKPPQEVGTNRAMRQGWNSVTRDGPLYTEYTDFQDFEGCMDYKGWARVHYVTPQQVEHSANVYNETILGHLWGQEEATMDEERRFNGDKEHDQFN